MIEKKTYYKLSDIIEKHSPSCPFKIVINNKFYIILTLKNFHKNIYRDVIRKFYHLPVLKEIREKTANYNMDKFFLESNDFEEAILKIENEIYDMKNLYLTKKEVGKVWK